MTSDCDTYTYTHTHAHTHIHTHTHTHAHAHTHSNTQTSVVIESGVLHKEHVVDIGEVDSIVVRLSDSDVAQMRHEVGAAQSSARHVETHIDQFARLGRQKNVFYTGT